jgi:steroid delta-isomerase-like uncharacterized protein
MSDSTNELIRELLEAWNQHDPNRVAKLYAPEYEEEDVAAVGKHRGPNAARGTFILYLRAFPDLTLTAEEALVDGDRVALSWILCGTHRGRLMNIPATGRQVRVRGVSLMTVRDGQIAHTTRVWDLAGLLRTFGLLPELS